MGHQLKSLLDRVKLKASTEQQTEMGGLCVSLGIGEDGEELYKFRCDVCDAENSGLVGVTA